VTRASGTLSTGSTSAVPTIAVRIFIATSRLYAPNGLVFAAKCGWRESCKAVLSTLRHHQQLCAEGQAKKMERCQWKDFFWLCKKGHIKMVKRMLHSREGKELPSFAERRRQLRASTHP
jgi:hypothetical protein